MTIKETSMKWRDEIVLAISVGLAALFLGLGAEPRILVLVWFAFPALYVFVKLNVMADFVREANDNSTEGSHE